MLAQILREGFAQAHRHPGLILVDVLWKLVWLGLTLGGLVVVAYSFLPELEWPSANVGVIDVWIAAGLVRQFWNENAAALAAALLSVLGFAIVFYFVLETLFRRRLVVPSSRGGVAAPASLAVFAGSSLAKAAILMLAAVVLGLIASGSAYTGIAALTGFTALIFLLTVIDTLIRAGAVELLGTDLLAVTGVIGTLLLFEFLIGASLGIAVVAGVLSISSSFEALAMLGATALVLLLVNFLHSYLLVVRFSAVGIMSRNVIDI